MTTTNIGPCECCGSSSSTSSSSSSSTTTGTTATTTTGEGGGCCAQVTGGTVEIISGGACNHAEDPLNDAPNPGPSTADLTIGVAPVILSLEIYCTGDEPADWSLVYSFDGCGSSGGTVAADSVVIDDSGGECNVVEVTFTITIDEDDCCDGSGGGSTAEVVATFN